MERIYELMEQIETMLNENDYYPEIGCNGSTITIDIHWGDWKHDHIAITNFITSYFPLKLINTIVTENDGSDCYSARHYFVERN